ncbi:hypothetical protein BKH43_04200 [Helicobacter sp. 13S00401-1]|uniref:hypothetical protein n=1 Tax=Helicobacter sp. 13S00401-1 TaxID=1905758 RepID=UPI000BA70A14|nr:hypothetical protein [Helicobacter sp. 13S00401-1]PAF50765.1 hypothetical protein BKH43_04200 [Helicobacter sp. 13S00401-1]
MKRYITCILFLVCTFFYNPFLQAQDSNQDKPYKDFVIGDQALIKGGLKGIDTISGELRDKTGFSVYLSLVDKTPSYVKTGATLSDQSLKQAFENRRIYEDKVIRRLNSPYAIIFFYKQDYKISVRSDGGFLDPNELLEDYAYPYLPLNNEKPIPKEEKIDYSLFNLYSAIVQRSAKHYGVKVESAFNPSDKPEGIVKWLLYLMLIVLVGLFLYGTYKSKQRKKA